MTPAEVAAALAGLPEVHYRLELGVASLRADLLAMLGVKKKLGDEQTVFRDDEWTAEDLLPWFARAASAERAREIALTGGVPRNVLRAAGFVMRAREDKGRALMPAFALSLFNLHAIERVMKEV
jgi:hypothetical protein